MIVDANIFKGYFQHQMGTTHSLCGCPNKIIGKASAATPIYYDFDGIVENEWMSVVDRDWFASWLAAQLQSGAIAYAKPIIDSGLEKNLTTLGFPRGRDVVYIRLCLGVMQIKKSGCEFFTEDLDFYDPKKKRYPAKTRIAILTKSTGPVLKLLKKRDILVSCA